MSSALSSVSKLLQAKAYETDPMSRGLTIKDMAAALNIPQQTVSYALANELEAARFGIFKLTPGRKRNILWGYSLDVANKANGLPYDTKDSAGIDSSVQAAEVSKLIEPCVNPEDHLLVEQIRKNLDSLIEKFKMQVPVGEEGEYRADMLGEMFRIYHDYYKKLGQNNDN